MEECWIAGSANGNFNWFEPENWLFIFPGIRPVICLKSGVTLEKVGDNQYNIVAPAPTLPEEDTLLASLEAGSPVDVTIPEGVVCVKVVAQGGKGGLGSSYLMNQTTSVSWGEEDSTYYVGVTPGATYNLLCADGEYWYDIYYSQSINETTPDVTDYM